MQQVHGRKEHALIWGSLTDVEPEKATSKACHGNTEAWPWKGSMRNHGEKFRGSKTTYNGHVESWFI